MSEVIASGFGLPEGPVYDSAEHRLLFTDAACGGVWAVDPATGDVNCVVEHRRGIGGLALHADGGYIVSGRNLAWKRTSDTVVLAEFPYAALAGRFNDITTSPTGGVYAGTIDYDPTTGHINRPGDLYYIDPRGRARIVATDFMQTNGLGVSPDGGTLYHVDSGPRVLYRYDILDPDTGLLGPRSEVHQWPNCTPDGIAIAATGEVLVAVARRGEQGFIAVLAPEGSEIERWAASIDHVTSVCVGGRDGRSVFATMGGGASGVDRSGLVMQLDQQIEALPRPLATIRPSHADDQLPQKDQ